MEVETKLLTKQTGARHLLSMLLLPFLRFFLRKKKGCPPFNSREDKFKLQAAFRPTGMTISEGTVSGPPGLHWTPLSYLFLVASEMGRDVKVFPLTLFTNRKLTSPQSNTLSVK